MDRNTITGLILIFAIFVGFSLYNNHKRDKSFDSIVAVADSLYDAGDLGEARSEYLKALQYKPGEAVVVEKVNAINLIIAPVEAQGDTVSGTADISDTGTENIISTPGRQLARLR